MDVEKFFSPAEREEIRAAVAEVERQSAGEIVPYVVAASDDYAELAWKGAAFGSLAGVVVAVLWHAVRESWGVGVLELAVPAPLGAAIGFLAARLSIPFRRWLAGPELLGERSEERARAAFLEQEVFRTRDRTGILLFLSLFEHRVVVLADSGIHRQVPEGEWDGIAQGIVAGIRARRPGRALAEAIRRSGELLARRGVTLQPADTNELSDELRTGR